MFLLITSNFLHIKIISYSLVNTVVTGQYCHRVQLLEFHSKETR